MSDDKESIIWTKARAWKTLNVLKDVGREDWIKVVAKAILVRNKQNSLTADRLIEIAQDLLKCHRQIKGEKASNEKTS